MGPQDPKDVARDTARDLSGLVGELAALKADATHWLTDATLSPSLSGAVGCCTSSKTPESQVSSCGRPIPRWSVVGGGQASCPTKSTAGLSGWSPTVRVGPPLSCNPAGSRMGLVFEREPRILSETAGVTVLYVVAAVGGGLSTSTAAQLPPYSVAVLLDSIVLLTVSVPNWL